MIKRVCDKCGKEIDQSKKYGALEVSLMLSCGRLGPEYQFDLCDSCVVELLSQCGVKPR